MRLGFKRVAVVCLALCCAGGHEPGHGGTIRHDRDDFQYTDLALLPEFDSVGALIIDGEPGFASGTLIKPQWVLTSAHAVSPSPETVAFELGLNQYEAAEWIIHPAWTGVFGRGIDVALIRLQTPVPDITPAPLFTGNLEVGETATMVGFGETGTGLTGAIEFSEGTKRAGDNVIDALGSAIRVDARGPAGDERLKSPGMATVTPFLGVAWLAPA